MLDSLEEDTTWEKFLLIIGKVVHLEVDERIFCEKREMDFERAKPLGVVLGDSGMHFTHPVSSGRNAQYKEMFLPKA